MLTYGKNVLFMTESKKIKKVYLSKSRKDNEVLSYLKNNHIHFVLTDMHVLNKMCKENHQGIIIETEDYVYSSLDDVLGEDFVVILDHLEDPHNFGAIIRTCEAAGVKSIIIPKDRSVSVNAAVVKTSVGTVSSVSIVKVTNLVETIKKLKKNDFFVYASDMDGTDFRDVSFAGKKALVIGNEGSGVSSLVLKNCDEVVKIPMNGKVNSLNASVAAAILIFKMGGLS